MSNKVINIYKSVGETPLEAINKYKNQNPEYKNIKMSYAGRLDPMAEGPLIILVGDENKNRKKYEAMDKTYEFEVLFGISTDSYDILGIPDANEIRTLNKKSIDRVRKISNSLIGTFSQKFPPYSSKPVNGRPLFYWAREGKLGEIELPSKQITVYSLDIIESRNLSINELKIYITESIKKLKGNFRQEEILNSWNNVFIKYCSSSITVIKFKIHGSSGMYVRSIGVDIGEKLGVRTMVLKIKKLG